MITIAWYNLVAIIVGVLSRVAYANDLFFPGIEIDVE